MIDEKIRKFENWHILLWLLKDLCWVMGYKTMGTIMIVPRVSLAIIITYKTRKVFSELVHNLSVVCWISANSVWMFGEFFMKDDTATKPYASYLFFLGLGILFAYYIHYYFKKWKA